nr:DUF1134 domain-containing protein [Pseudovibrio sp. M1P-2-3]
MVATTVSTASAQQATDQRTYSENDIVEAGHHFFGSISSGLAKVVEKAVQKYGEPNGYILGEEGSAAFFAGASYGEGQLFTRNAGTHTIFWQGPSIGWDMGGNGSRVMMLVYNLPNVDSMFKRYVGAKGSAYMVGGFGMQALSNSNVVVVPVRAGVGARLGVNMGYLKFTRTPTWNPF